jgi:hypothetical protein
MSIPIQPTYLDQLARQLGVSDLRWDELARVDGGDVTRIWALPLGGVIRKTFCPAVFRWRRGNQSFAYAVAAKTIGRQVFVWFWGKKIWGERVDLDERGIMDELIKAIQSTLREAA